MLEATRFVTVLLLAVQEVEEEEEEEEETENFYVHLCDWLYFFYIVICT